MLKVGQMPFVNVAPFFCFWRDSSMDFIQGPPRVLGKLASEGKIDLAPLPIYDCFLLEENFEPLGNFGIAATDKVMSVFLFSKKPIDQLNNSVVSLTSESSTSVNLLKLMFQEKYKLTGVKFSDESPDAVLMIGDRALEESGQAGKWPHVYDLANLWHAWTSLPFTFARWVVSKRLSESERMKLAKTLEENLEHSISNLDVISTIEASRTGIAKDTLLTYLKNFTFRLGAEEEKGLTLFKTKLKSSGLL